MRRTAAGSVVRTVVRIAERQGERLFEDSYARDLAAPRGFELLDKYGGGLREFVAIRTRYLDDAIWEALADTDIRQVVLIAAGMDTRAFRLRLPDDVTVYEVDHADLLVEKRRRLEALGARPTVRRREADLATEWLPTLTAAGFDADRPTLWIPEALFFFLTEEQSSGLLRTLRSASAPGSRLDRAGAEGAGPARRRGRTLAVRGAALECARRGPELADQGGTGQQLT